MSWEEVSVRGYAEFEQTCREQQRRGRRVFVYFSGDKDPASGTSWCPDCVKAEPIVRAELPNMPEASVFIYCQVGDRPYALGGAAKYGIMVYTTHCRMREAVWTDLIKFLHSWKDPNNEFRKNLKLTGVPTLLKYGTPQKLVEEECFKSELVRMLFTED